MLFLTLASVITRVSDREEEDSIAKASSCWMWDLKEWSLLLLKRWKENWLGKRSTILLPSRNSGLIGSKARKTSLNLLSISTTWFFKRSHCLLVSKLRDSAWGGDGLRGLLSINDLIRWLVGRVCTLNWDLPLSFWRWRWIGMSPAITSIPYKGDILNAPRIHIAALL